MRDLFSSLPLLSILIAVIMALGIAGVGFVPLQTPTLPEEGEAQSKPIVFTPPARKISLKLDSRLDSRLDSKSTAPIRVQALASLTLIEANADDTLRGLLVLTLDESERRRLSRLKGQSDLDWQTLPEMLGRREVRIKWVRGTACPDLDLELPSFNLDYAGRKLEVPAFRFRIDIAQETVEAIPQLLCGWTRQINTGHPRLGIILAINRLLISEEQP